jgi:hypothetical protein
MSGNEDQFGETKMTVLGGRVVEIGFLPRLLFNQVWPFIASAAELPENSGAFLGGEPG